MKTLVRLVAVAALVAVSAGMARANNLVIGDNNGTVAPNINWIYMNYGGTDERMPGGGSFVPAWLDGLTLDYLYCVDLGVTISLPGVFDDTVVTNNAVVHGSQTVTNADKVAFLLETYAGSAVSSDQAALQAAIWHYVHGVSLSTVYYTAADAITLKYQALLADVADGYVGDVTKFSWLTPKTDPTQSGFQALVTSKQGDFGIVPEGGSLALLLTGLAPLGVALRRRVK